MKPTLIWLVLPILTLLHQIACADDYLIRIDVKSEHECDDLIGTIEFPVESDKPIYLRTTFGIKPTQFILKGRLDRLDATSFELHYSAQIAELQSNPSLRRTSQGKSKLTINEIVSSVSDASSSSPQSSLNFAVSLRQFNPEIGTREVSSGWKVRLLDPSGSPISGANAGLLDPLTDMPVVEGVSDGSGLVAFTEGREDIPTTTFFARRGDYHVTANLNVDMMRQKGHKCFMVVLRADQKDAPARSNSPRSGECQVTQE